MNLLENYYMSNYFFYPIYLVYDIFMEINKEYIDYVKSTYYSSTFTNNDNDDDSSCATSI